MMEQLIQTARTAAIDSLKSDAAGEWRSDNQLFAHAFRRGVMLHGDVVDLAPAADNLTAAHEALLVELERDPSKFAGYLT